MPASPGSSKRAVIVGVFRGRARRVATTTRSARWTRSERPDRRRARTGVATRTAVRFFATQSVAAQRRLPELDDARIAFAGAYHGWGPVGELRQ